MNHAQLITVNDHVLTAMDVETTGRSLGHHEVCQMAAVVLDCHLKPVAHFYTNIRPQFPERIDPEAVRTHGLTAEVLAEAPDVHEVSDMLWDWFKDLMLPPGKKLIPLVHNAQFDIPFLQFMLGELFGEVIGFPTRDTQAIVCGMMDKAAYNGTKIPFDRASLGSVCETLGVKLDDAHDALADSLATARVYRALLARGSW